jgi:hypothetical protein
MTGKSEIEVQPRRTASMGSYSGLRSTSLRDQTFCARESANRHFSRGSGHSRHKMTQGTKGRLNQDPESSHQVLVRPPPEGFPEHFEIVTGARRFPLYDLPPLAAINSATFRRRLHAGLVLWQVVDVR